MKNETLPKLWVFVGWTVYPFLIYHIITDFNTAVIFTGSSVGYHVINIFFWIFVLIQQLGIWVKVSYKISVNL